MRPKAHPTEGSRERVIHCKNRPKTPKSAKSEKKFENFFFFTENCLNRIGKATKPL